MKIAIIGSGITGLATAYLLNPHHDITLYEKENRLGGHSCTIDVPTENGSVPVDIGFIVYNHRNYPNLRKLFEKLQVPTVRSDMSFGVASGELQYSTRNFLNLFAEKKNILRPKFWKMLRDVINFNRQAKGWVAQNSDAAIGNIPSALGLSSWFKNYYLLPMAAAIWSTSQKQIVNFPAQVLIRFFENHGLLTIFGQPKWYTVKGGSREYVKRIADSFTDKIRLNQEVSSVIVGDTVSVICNGEKTEYDHVIFACHSDQALQMIDTPTEQEQTILGSINYHPNKVYLHSDKSFLPPKKVAWASWNYLANDDNDKIALSYWMNNLQPLDTDKTIITTLNPTAKPENIYYETTMHHPLFDAKAIKAQSQIDDIQGKRRLWFCGAWCNYGFHEDGLNAAIDIAERLGVKVPW